MDVIHKICLWLAGPHYASASAATKQCCATHLARFEQLDRLLSAATESSERAWLYRNRAERMDPTVEVLFAPDRAAFHVSRYAFASQFVESLRCADVACGTGYGTQMLRAAGASTVIGIDIDPETVHYAVKVHSADGIEFRCAPGDETGLPAESVDAVISFETIEHVSSDMTLLVEFARVLTPGGLLIVSTPNNWPVDASPHHVRTYDRTEFEKTLGIHFIIEGMYNQNSGGASAFNHGQPAGIVPTTAENDRWAECFIAVARKPC